MKVMKADKTEKKLSKESKLQRFVNKEKNF